MAPCRPLAAKPVTLVASSSRSSVQPNNRVVKQRRNHHTATDWERKKPMITQLYTRENRPVKDVIAILKSEFAFNTSRRQLFTKLNEWGVQKNKKRDAEYIQEVPEEFGGENSAVELDNMVPAMANPSPGLFLPIRSPSYLPDNREILGEMNQPALPQLFALPAQPRHTLGSCVDASPSAQFLQLSEISLDTLDLRTPRFLSDDGIDPPWLLPHALSPQSTQLAGPTVMAIRRRSQSPAILESNHQPPSETSFSSVLFPAMQETTTSIGGEQDERTSQIYLSLENSICSAIRFATGKEHLINHNNALQLKEDLRSLLDLTQSSLVCTHSSRRRLCNKLYLVHSLISSASRIAINTNSSFQFPHHLLPKAHITSQERRTTVHVGTTILDVATKTSKDHLAQTQHDVRISNDDGIYTGIKIVFKPKGSTFALQIEVNQCQLVGGSFSSIPRISIKNIVSSHSLVFAVAASGSVQDLKTLFASGQANIGDHDEYGCSLLHHSLENPPMCQFLAQSGLDLDETCSSTRWGWKIVGTPLYISYRKNMETARILLAKGADPTIETRNAISFTSNVACSLEPKDFTLLRDVLNLSAHFGVFNVRTGLEETLLLSTFAPDRLARGTISNSDQSFDVVEKIELLLNRGSYINEKDPQGSNCLNLFFRSNLEPPPAENWLSGLIYATQQGADVYSADMYGVAVSQIAYAERFCGDSERDLGSYRGDLWDAVLHACGYNILEFRIACPRRARYSELYTRKDFESLWKDREHLCPYWEDNEWPAALGPERRVIDLSTSQTHLCCCILDGPVRWLNVHNDDKHCFYSGYYVSETDSDSDIDRGDASSDDDDDGDDDDDDDDDEAGEGEAEVISPQSIQDLSSTHDFHEPDSPEDAAMQSFFRELEEQFDPIVFDAQGSYE